MLSAKSLGTIKNLLKRDDISVELKSYTLSSMSSNDAQTIQKDVSKQGYDVLGTIGWFVTNNGAFVNVYGVFVDGNTLNFSLRNNRDSAITPTINAVILYVKSLGGGVVTKLLQMLRHLFSSREEVLV